jgi:phage tail sheath gpL-like
MSSNAVGQERISRVIGYKITKGNFSESSPNLPQRIAIIGEANTANQSGLSADTKHTITSAQQAGQLFGFGSPLYHQARIYFPQSGDGIGGIPVDVYPQEAAGGASSRILSIAITGTATANATHYVKIAGRTNVDGQYYEVNIASGDTNTAIGAKINDAINAVLGAPVTSTLDSPPSTVIAETKWQGLTAQDVTIEMDTNNNAAGITYVVTETQAATGTPSITGALNAFANIWYTFVSSCYGTVSAVMTSLESFNGIADPNSPTGRYAGIIMKPCVALIGSTESNVTTLGSLTDARKLQMTIAICPAPNSKGLPCEAAANYGLLAARCAQDTPHLDIQGRYLPDMPTPDSIGDMASYTNRDMLVKKGCSTVDLVAGLYQVQDFVTTYHPDGELPPQFRYVRNLQLDFNVRYGYYLLELINVVDHTIANDADVVTATSIVKPKQWKQVLQAYFADLSKRALIADPDFSADSLLVNISTVNPDRLETFFRYKRTGCVRIASTTAEAGFNFVNA